MKAMSLADQLLFQFTKVVDLTVKDDPQRPVFVTHRLFGSDREINDGEAAVPEPDPAGKVNPLGISPPVSKNRGHLSDQSRN